MRRVGVSILFAMGLSLATSAARADEVTGAACEGDTETCGRKAFDAGIEAYQAKDYEAAVAQFQTAYNLRPHPIVLFNLALAQAKLELYVEAVAAFEKTLADPETPKDLIKKIRQEKAAAEAKIAVIEVEAGGGAEIFIDEKPVTERPARVSVNPGDHKFRAVQSGRELANRTIHVDGGERVQLSVARTREVVIDGGQEDKPPKKDTGERKPVERRGISPVWFYVGTGVTVVLGGLTTWSALDTKRSFDQYEKDLPRLTQAEANERVDEGHGKELRTNVLIGATAIAGAGTIVLGLFAIDWGGSPGQNDAGVGLAPNGVRAFGRF